MKKLIAIACLLLAPMVLMAAERPETISEDMEAYLIELIDTRINQVQASEAMRAQMRNEILAYVSDQDKKRKNKEQKQPPPVDVKIDHTRGNLAAPFSVIEYSDFECPYCKRFHSTLESVVANYPDQVNWVYRHYPLSFHKGAQKKAEFVECVAEYAGNEVFWQVTDLMYKKPIANGYHQQQLLDLLGNFSSESDAVKGCLLSDRFAQKVKLQSQLAGKAGVRGTPGSFIVNNATGDLLFVNGALNYQQFKVRLDNFIAQSN